MNKIKVVTKDKQTLIVIKGMNDQRIQRHELEAINNNGARGLLYLQVVEKRFSFQLVYDVTGYITLQKLLAAPQNKQSFIKILTCIQKTLRSIEDIHFDSRRLLLDFEKVMVNPATGEIVFVYAPIQPFDSGATLRTFMLDISSHCVFPTEEDTSFVEAYVKMLNKNANFSLVELERFLDELITGKKQGCRGGNICPKCSAVVQDTANFCVVCGEKLRGNTSRTGIGDIAYHPQRNAGNDRESGSASRKSIFLDDDIVDSQKNTGDGSGFSSNSWRNTFQDDGGTYSQHDNSNDRVTSSGTRRTMFLGGGSSTRRTTALGSSELGNGITEAYLIRKRTEEKILIDSDVFRVGFDWSTSDYAIDDNETISTRHAQILRRNGRYYVVDVGSTNHTFVDQRMIREQVEMEVYSGTTIRFSNEEFIFWIEDGRR